MAGGGSGGRGKSKNSISSSTNANDSIITVDQTNTGGGDQESSTAMNEDILNETNNNNNNNNKSSKKKSKVKTETKVEEVVSNDEIAGGVEEEQQQQQQDHVMSLSGDDGHITATSSTTESTANQNSADLEICKVLLQSVREWVSETEYVGFYELDPKQIPGYLKVIKRPVDIKKAQVYMDNGHYNHAPEYGLACIIRIFENSSIFNESLKNEHAVNAAYYDMSEKVKSKISEKISELGPRAQELYTKARLILDGISAPKTPPLEKKPKKSRDMMKELLNLVPSTNFSLADNSGDRIKSRHSANIIEEPDQSINPNATTHTSSTVTATLGGGGGVTNKARKSRASTNPETLESSLNDSDTPVVDVSNTTKDEKNKKKGASSIIPPSTASKSKKKRKSSSAAARAASEIETSMFDPEENDDEDAHDYSYTTIHDEANPLPKDNVIKEDELESCKVILANLIQDKNSSILKVPKKKEFAAALKEYVIYPINLTDIQSDLVAVPMKIQSLNHFVAKVKLVFLNYLTFWFGTGYPTQFADRSKVYSMIERFYIMIREKFPDRASNLVPSLRTPESDEIHQKIINIVEEFAQNNDIDPFMLPPTNFNLEGYSDIVKRPIYFVEILDKNMNDYYSSLDMLWDDFRLMLKNCIAYWTTRGSEGLLRVEVAWRLWLRFGKLSEKYFEVKDLKYMHNAEAKHKIAIEQIRKGESAPTGITTTTTTTTTAVSSENTTTTTSSSSSNEQKKGATLKRKRESSEVIVSSNQDEKKNPQTVTVKDSTKTDLIAGQESIITTGKRIKVKKKFADDDDETDNVVVSSHGKHKSSGSGANTVTTTAAAKAPPTKPEIDVFNTEMDEKMINKFLRILATMKEQRGSSDFFAPVDVTLAPSYPTIIEHPMDFGTIRAKLNNSENPYKKISSVIRDGNLVFSNCAKYTPMETADIRVRAKMLQNTWDKEILKLKEQLMRKFNPEAFAEDEHDDQANENTQEALEAALPKYARAMLDGLRILQKMDVMQMFSFELDWKSLELLDYPTIVSHPMDYNTIEKKIMDGKYSNRHEITEDIRLVFANSTRYNKEQTISMPVVTACRDQARAFEKFLFDSGFIPKPYDTKLHKTEKEYKNWRVECASILDQIMETKAALPFIEKFRHRDGHPDYTKIIKYPMHLKKIREQLFDGYQGPHFLAEDVRAVFSNALAYNTREIPSYPVRTWADALLEAFDSAFARLRNGEEGIILEVSDDIKEGNPLPEGTITSVDGATISSGPTFANPSSPRAPNATSGVNYVTTQGMNTEQDPLNQIYEKLLKNEFCAELFTVPVLETHSDEEFRQSYLQIINQPMDLKTIGKKIKSGFLGDYSGPERMKKFASDVELICYNCELFNSQDDVVAEYLRERADHVRQYFLDLYYEIEPCPDVEERKLRRQKREQVLNRATVDRRILSLSKIVSRLSAQKLNRINLSFLAPVDWQRQGLIDYPDIVKHPMDLGTIRQKVEQSEYSIYKEFVSDVRLVFSNCLLYNPDIEANQGIRSQALQMSDLFESLWAESTVDGAEKEARQRLKIKFNMAPAEPDQSIFDLRLNKKQVRIQGMKRDRDGDNADDDDDDDDDDEDVRFLSDQEDEGDDEDFDSAQAARRRFQGEDRRRNSSFGGNRNHIRGGMNKKSNRMTPAFIPGVHKVRSSSASETQLLDRIIPVLEHRDQIEYEKLMKNGKEVLEKRALESFDRRHMVTKIVLPIPRHISGSKGMDYSLLDEESITLSSFSIPRIKTKTKKIISIEHEEENNTSAVGNVLPDKILHLTSSSKGNNDNVVTLNKAAGAYCKTIIHVALMDIGSSPPIKPLSSSNAGNGNLGPGGGLVTLGKGGRGGKGKGGGLSLAQMASLTQAASKSEPTARVWYKFSSLFQFKELEIVLHTFTIGRSTVDENDTFSAYSASQKEDQGYPSMFKGVFIPLQKKNNSSDVSHEVLLELNGISAQNSSLSSWTREDFDQVLKCIVVQNDDDLNGMEMAAFGYTLRSNLSAARNRLSLLSYVNVNEWESCNIPGVLISKQTYQMRGMRIFSEVQVLCLRGQIDHILMNGKQIL